MIRNGNFKKSISSIVMIMFMLSLILVQAPAAQAKTLQTPIDNPPNDTVALNVMIGDTTLPYTWGDITGADGYKFAGQATSDTYLETPETCEGIKLSDLLASIENQLGISLLDDYKIQAVSSDAYINQAVTVADARDYAANKYMLAYKVDGVSEACIGYQDTDPSVTYPPTYVRVARNRGGNDAFGRDAYMRLISSIQISKADGSAIELNTAPGVTESKEPGGDLSNAVFYIAVKDSAAGDTKYYYYTKAELQAFETQEAYTYDDHSVIKTVTCKGALLKDLLDNLNGVTITDDMVVQYAEEDGYHADAATTVSESNYKDTIESLTKETIGADASTRNPMRPIISYEIHEEYAIPDANNVNDDPGVFKDADNNSGYLRAYRDTGGANSAVIKYLLGVAVSTDGALLSGRNGCVVSSVSDKNSTIKVRDDITFKGLLPGMQYAVKAPAVTNANLTAGQTNPVLITVGDGAPADQTITFQYTEDTYFYVNDLTLCTIKNYTYTDLITMHQQLPDPESNTAPYGYSRPMYYRYNGVWISDLLSGLSGDYIIKLVAKNGSKTDITSDIDRYFAAYSNTKSKTNTNIPEGKRVTVTYNDAKVIIPDTGENVTGSAADDYTSAGKDVDVLMAAAEGIEITSANQGNTANKEPGGDISNAVFYIAVKDSAAGETKYYYYTKAELQAFETQAAYTYDDHSVIKTVTCKGALLKDLLDNLNGVTITDDMVVQYAEEDGYHADAATTVSESNYKDTIESLTKETIGADASTRNPMRPIISYEIHEEYAIPDANNVNDDPGVFKDADNNSGYLRAYRDTGGANSAVIKYLLGVAVSTDGALLSGSNGCVVSSVSDKNSTIKVRDDITFKGLLPGMQYAVKAPAVTNARLAAGQTDPVLITVESGAPAEQTVTFQYTEDTYFYVNNAISKINTNYTYTDLIAMHKQLPDASSNTAPYGYSRPMYYRYNGVWLNDLVSGLTGVAYTIKLVAKDGSKTDITSNIAQYFAAYSNTKSKSSTNIPEGKRVTVTYNDAKVIIPSTGDNITGSATDDYTTAGKDVDVLMAAVEGMEISAISSSSSGGGGGSSTSSISVSTTATGQLATSTGATVSKDGATVVIPAGAVSSDIQVTVAKGSASGLTVDSDSTLISDVYEITKNKDGNFTKDVTITLPFIKSKADQAKDELTICYWNGSKWAALDNVKVDWNAATVSGTVNHLSKFAVLAKTNTTVPTLAENTPKLIDISGHWANAAISSTINSGIVSGYPDGTFKPDQTISRAEFTVMLAKACKLSANGKKVFDDTPGHWAQSYIAAACDAGMVSGYTDKQFQPDALITREQMAVMAVNAVKPAASKTAVSFKDQKIISAWAQDAVASAVAAKLISGYQDQTFRPQDNASRAEAASVIARILEVK